MTGDSLVFVYGSLLKGLSNDGLLAEAEFLAAGATQAAYRLVDLGPYPGMVAGGATAVVGEVYRVPQRLLGALDELEDHPHVYVRTAISLADGREVLAYLLRPHLAEGRPEVASGDWRAYVQRRIHGARA
jgi:gamma-glutamylcyclotransferase (GGCT)/AIG2-like uncharacterized protein YtfP